jgi:septum formation inhibitor MinC
MIYTTSSNSAFRARLLRWSTPFWLTLTSVVLATHQASLSRLEGSVQEQADAVKLQLLEDRLIELERSNFDTSQNQTTVTQTQLKQTTDALSRRIEDMHTAIAGAAAMADLQTLQDQLQQLESKHQTATPPPVPSKLKPRKASKPTEPSFQIIGRELRGGERFLAINPLGSQSLEQSRIMRIGETYSGWRLQSFDAQTAEFVVDGELRRLNIQ